MRKQVPKKLETWLWLTRLAILLVVWSMWKERKKCFFDQVVAMPVDVFQRIAEEGG